MKLKINFHLKVFIQIFFNPFSLIEASESEKFIRDPAQFLPSNYFFSLKPYLHYSSSWKSSLKFQWNTENFLHGKHRNNPLDVAERGDGKWKDMLMVLDVDADSIRGTKHIQQKSLHRNEFCNNALIVFFDKQRAPLHIRNQTFQL